jgi:hypothetical protein
MMVHVPEDAGVIMFGDDVAEDLLMMREKILLDQGKNFRTEKLRFRRL